MFAILELARLGLSDSGKIAVLLIVKDARLTVTEPTNKMLSKLLLLIHWIDCVEKLK